MTTITLNGSTVNIAFNMATQIGFEEISGKPFHEIDLSLVKDKMALFAAAILANNPETDFNTEWLMKEATQAELTQLEKVVFDEVNKWAGIPSTLQESEDTSSTTTEEGEDRSDSKNDLPPASNTPCS